MKRALSLFILALGLGCGGTSVGRPCTQNTDCETGQLCVTAAPGGFCTRGCDAEGSTTHCPGGSVCAAHSGTLYCSPICQQQGDCREQYECNGLTGSNLKACRPKV